MTADALAHVAAQFRRAWANVPKTPNGARTVKRFWSRKFPGVVYLPQADEVLLAPKFIAPDWEKSDHVQL